MLNKERREEWSGGGSEKVSRRSRGCWMIAMGIPE